MPVDKHTESEALFLGERAESRGRLKVFLGYSSGVGKSFRMFDEGRRRRERGQDVVVGIVQSTVPEDVGGVLETLETIPPRMVDGQPTLDIAAVLRRRPQVCLVDALANDNPTGSAHRHRWQDVEDLLAAGISVISTINLQYIAEYQDVVERITGKRPATVVPKAFLRAADEIVVVDAPAEVVAARAGSLKPRLPELRELALLLAADVVDHQLESYLHRHGIRQSWTAHERIMVCVTPRANAALMIDTARRSAERLHGELIVSHVRQKKNSAEDREAMDRILAYARESGAAVEMLEGEEPVHAILEFARQRGVTQIFIGHTLQNGWRSRFFSTPVDRLIESAEGIDVRVFPQ